MPVQLDKGETTPMSGQDRAAQKIMRKQRGDRLCIARYIRWLNNKEMAGPVKPSAAFATETTANGTPLNTLATHPPI